MNFYVTGKKFNYLPEINYFLPKKCIFLLELIESEIGKKIFFTGHLKSLYLEKINLNF